MTRLRYSLLLLANGNVMEENNDCFESAFTKRQPSRRTVELVKRSHLSLTVSFAPSEKKPLKSCDSKPWYIPATPRFLIVFVKTS